ncbi:response regulator [Sagittula sp. SSi028]|uniref:response regulator n=1 Tax=Sagittula sp. SSi028 TaxID=3400636 RepID=UPI003AF7C19E
MPETEFDLNALIDDILGVLAPAHLQTTVQLRRDQVGDGPLRVLGTEARLQDELFAVLEHAIQLTEPAPTVITLLRGEAGVTLHVTRGQLDIWHSQCLPCPDRFSGLLVLVAEDNATIQMVVAKLLGPTGVTLVQALDGQQAIDRYERQTFDLVLMDVAMPVMSGLQAARAIRQIEARGARPHVPIIALTGNAATEDRAACLQAGMSDVLSKPVNRAQLIDALTRWTGHRTHQQSA